MTAHTLECLVLSLQRLSATEIGGHQAFARESKGEADSNLSVWESPLEEVAGLMWEEVLDLSEEKVQDAFLCMPAFTCARMFCCVPGHMPREDVWGLSLHKGEQRRIAWEEGGSCGRETAGVAWGCRY